MEAGMTIEGAGYLSQMILIGPGIRIAVFRAWFLTLLEGTGVVIRADLRGSPDAS
jgi:hypothetical protein